MATSGMHTMGYIYLMYLCMGIEPILSLICRGIISREIPLFKGLIEASYYTQKQLNLFQGTIFKDILLQKKAK